MLLSQVWLARRTIRPIMAKPQTIPLEKLRGSNSGLRRSFVFWMSLYKDYLVLGQTKNVSLVSSDAIQGQILKNVMVVTPIHTEKRLV